MNINITFVLITSALMVCTGTIANASTSPSASYDNGAIYLSNGRNELKISAKSPKFVFTANTVNPANPKSFNTDDLLSGKQVKIDYSALKINDENKLNVSVLLKWSEKEQLLRKWVKYKLTGKTPLLLEEIILDDIDVKLKKFWTHGDFSVIPDDVQSHPIFLQGFFTGIEFPVSSARAENDRLILAHRPGLWIQPGKWYESRKAVYGISEYGEEMQSFERYIEMHRPKPYGFHINYNSWWTSPVPFSENDILDLMNDFRVNMYEPYKTAFDTFTIDMGWSDLETVWEINKELFPKEFSSIQYGADKMGSNLGLWISPSSAYPGAVNNYTAMENGYEAVMVGDEPRTLCLGGDKYAAQFKNQLVDIISKYGIKQIKLDAYTPVCNTPGHGHEIGLLSAEKIAEGFIAACKAMRKAAPDIWLEPTCFGYNPSPWWLFYSNSLMGTIGDDAPYGRVPCPVYRESYTTARDYFNLQGAFLLPNPISAQEVLGIVHQTEEPFMNDAVTCIMRGHMFQPVYMNPKFMNDSRWKSFAEVLNWARKNAKILQNTQPIIPASWENGKIPHFTDADKMPREPYGFSHAAGNKGFIMLRNPWIAKTSLDIKIDKSLGFDSDDIQKLSITSIYPEARVYAQNISYGDKISIPLAAYETIVLSVEPKSPKADIPNVSQQINNKITVSAIDKELSLIQFNDNIKPFGPNWTARLGDADKAFRLKLNADVSSTNDDNRFLILIEGDKPLNASDCQAAVNGKAVDVEYIPSAAGWSATQLPIPEHWAFISCMLPKGDSSISVELFTGDECKQISSWIWATKSTPDKASRPNMIPAPELISVDSEKLFSIDEQDMQNLPTLFEDRPVSRIEGIYLDSLTPKSVVQGYGKLEKNQSVWEKPLIIAGKQYIRGLGTHSNSRIEYELDGKYSRFLAEAGVDGNNRGTVTFEIWVDGIKKWETGLMHYDDPAKMVDIDLKGAKSLVLIVGDGGNGISGDHADWCNAKFLY